MGDVDLIEVFIDHDGPRLFSGRSSAGLFYLGAFVEEDAMSETYLLAPMSLDRLQEVRAGHIDLRDAFCNVAGGHLWKVLVSDAEQTAAWTSVEELSSNWFPTAGETLSLATPTAGLLEFSELEAMSADLQRTVLAIELDSAFPTTEYPLRDLGEVLQAIQGTVDALGQVVVGQVTFRGAVQSDVLEFSELTFLDRRAASFAVLAATRPGSLFEDPRAIDTLKILVQTVDASSDPEAFQPIADHVKARALSKYGELLETLDDAGTGIRIHLAAQDQQPVTSATLTQQHVPFALEMVRSFGQVDVIEITILATLVGVNVRTHAFELFHEPTERKYSGKALPGAKPQLEGLTTGTRYRAKLQETTTINSVTGEERKRHALIDIQPAAAPEEATIQDISAEA